jgi:hypothetical protein
MIIDCGKRVGHQEALRVIFNYEKIPYETCVGANSVFAVTVDNSDAYRAVVALQQWRSAIQSIINSIEESHRGN